MAQSDILLVDDDPDLLKLISLRLTSAGYRVRTADSGETALAAVAVERPAAVITDLRMPGIDGLQLFESIHRQHAALPVIILTAHGTIPDAVSGDPARRVRLSDQALRQPGPAAESRCCTATFRRRTLRRRQRGRKVARWHHHPQPANGRPAAAGPAGCRFRGERSDLRRVRNRQGTARTGDPRREPAQRQAFRRRELRCDPGPTCSNPSCSGMRVARLPARSRPTRACSRRPTAERCSWTRSATCRYRCR